jgi:hypothetical protein
MFAVLATLKVLVPLLSPSFATLVSECAIRFFFSRLLIIIPEASTQVSWGTPYGAQPVSN